MKEIKVIVDLEVIGSSYKNNQTCVYRVAYEVFRRLISRKDLTVLYSIFNFNNDKKINGKVKQFLSEKEIVIKPANSYRRVRFLPLRKEKFFRKIYYKIGIIDYKISYNKEMNTANIYHSFFDTRY